MKPALIAVAVAVLLAPFPIHAQPAGYSVAMMGEVGSPGLGQFWIADINDDGVVVGTFTRFHADCYHPFVWKLGWNAPLDLGCGHGNAIGQSAGGMVRVVGTGVGMYAHATIWDVDLTTRTFTATDVHDLIPGSGGEYTTSLSSINRRGEIAGSTGSGVPFLLHGTRALPLPTIPYRQARPLVNDAGIVALDYSTPQGSGTAKYLFEHGRLTFMEGMGQVVSINERGHVVGRRTYDAPQWHGVWFENGVTRLLPDPAGYSFSAPLDMSDAGEIVGQVGTDWTLADGPFYVWRGPAKSPVRLEFADGAWPNCKGCWGKILQARMNSSGMIAGVAKYLTNDDYPAVVEMGFIMARSAPVTSHTPVTQIPTTATLPSRETGLIVAVNRSLPEDRNPEIYVMKGDGTSPVRLTTNTGEDNNPRVSPDGNSIVFESDRDGPMEIYRMALDGSNVVRLTNNQVRDKNPVWSPDGTKIAFARFDDDLNWDIWVMDADGGSPFNVTNSPDADEVTPSWSPDGTRIAYSTNVDGPFEIHDRNVIGAAGLREITWQDAPAGSWPYNRFQPLFEPAGGRISWTEQRQAFEIYSSEPNDFDTWAQLSGCSVCGGNDESPSWSADRQKLALTNFTREWIGSVVVIDMTTGASAAVSDQSFAADWVPSVSAGGGAGIPSNLVSFATSATSASVGWRGVDGATSYEIYRKSAGSAFALRATVTTTSFSDSGLSSNATYIYKVRALFPSVTSEFSSVDAATTVMFSDDPLMPGQIARAAHVEQLRTAVSAMHAAAGMTAPTFTDAVLSASVSIKAAHITELRNALSAVRSSIGLPGMSYTDPTITAGSTPLRAAHVNQLRNGAD